MTARTKKPRRQIPDFKSREEEAAFWDTHDFTDYMDGFKPVKVRFAKNLSGHLTVRLDPSTLGKMQALAYKKGIGPTTLARMWIIEQLRQQKEESNVNA